MSEQQSKRVIEQMMYIPQKTHHHRASLLWITSFLSWALCRSLRLWWHIPRHALQGKKDLEDHLTSSSDESKFGWKYDRFHFGFVPLITALTMSPFLTIKAGKLQAWKHLYFNKWPHWFSSICFFYFGLPTNTLIYRLIGFCPETSTFLENARWKASSKFWMC